MKIIIKFGAFVYSEIYYIMLQIIEVDLEIKYLSTNNKYICFDFKVNEKNTSQHILSSIVKFKYYS